MQYTYTIKQKDGNITLLANNFEKLDFYVDGAASTKTNCGGWACITVANEEAIDVSQGREKDTTNNRMELMSFLTALKNINSTGIKSCCIFSDSAYVVNCFKDKWYEKWMLNNWRTSDRQHVKNKDLWEDILNRYFDLINKDFKIEIIKVQSHKDNKFNNYADLVAVKERKALELLEGF